MQLEFFLRAQEIKRKILGEVEIGVAVKEYFKAQSGVLVQGAQGPQPSFAIEGFLGQDVIDQHPKAYAEFQAFYQANQEALNKEARENIGQLINVSAKIKAANQQPVIEQPVEAEEKPAKKGKKESKDELL